MLSPLHCLYLCNHIINFNHSHNARKCYSIYWDTLSYIFAHLHRNSIRLRIPYPRPISLDSNVKGAFDVNHYSDNWPNCNGHYRNCNCTHDLVVEIKQCQSYHFYFLFFSQRNFTERIGQNFPSDLFPTKTIFKRKLRRRISEGVEGWTVAPFGTEDWGSFTLGILNGHDIKFVLSLLIYHLKANSGLVPRMEEILERLNFVLSLKQSQVEWPSGTKDQGS